MMREAPCDSGTVIRQLAPDRPAAIELTDDAGSPTGMVAAAAAVRGAAVAVSGAILAAGLALVLWAVTPASGADPAAALQGGVVAFASANLMPVVIGGVVFTLPPLLLTMVMAVLLASTARRGRFLPQGRYQEAVSVVVTAVVYGLVVAAITRGLGPPEAVPAGWVWTAAALALVAAATGMLGRGSAWRGWWQSVADDRLRVGVRGAGIGFAALIAGGGLALTAALVARFGSAVAVSALAAPSWSDGLGMAMLGLVYLPNAMIAGAGYVTGAGFEIGPGTYSPFASATVDLPAVPLLAAAPDQSGRSVIGLVLLAVPVVAGFLIARVICRRLVARFDRILASATAGALAGVLLGAAAAVARGGVGDGRWATLGSPPLLLGAVAAAELGIVAVGISALIGGRSVPWRLAVAAVPSSTATVDDSTAADAVDPTDDPTDGDLNAAEVSSHEDDVDLFDSDLFKDLPADQAVEDPGDGDGDTAYLDTAALEDTSPEDAALDDAALQGPAVDDASLRDAARGDAAPGYTAPADPAIEDTAPEDAALKYTATAGTAGEDVAREDAALEDTAPEAGAAPELGTTPEAAVALEPGAAAGEDPLRGAEHSVGPIPVQRRGSEDPAHHGYSAPADPVSEDTSADQELTDR